MYTPFKDKELRVIVFKIRLDTTGNVIWESIVVAVSHLVYYNTLLQNATDFITKWGSYFITKCVNFFITKCDGFITKSKSYYKTQQFYCKMRQLLQNATAQTKTQFFPMKEQPFL